MKTLINKLMLGAVAGSFLAIGGMNAIGQTPTPTPATAGVVDEAAKAALYQKFTGCYRPKVIDEIDPCVAIGKEYVQKFGTPPDDFNKFVEAQIPKLEQKKKDWKLAALYEKFAKAFQAKAWREFFDTGKQLLTEDPSTSARLDNTLLMATVGYDLSFSPTPDNTYNAEAINHAKSAIRMIESGVVSESKPGPNNTTLPATWGGTGTYAYKSKDNALAWMNFTIARLTADVNKDPAKALAVSKEAAPYFYKAVQLNGDVKKLPGAYQALGRYYREEFNSSVDQYDKCCKDLTEDTEQAKNLRGMQLAYADRALDAYARAYQAAKDDPKATQAFRDSLLKTVTDFYNVRYKKKEGAPAPPPVTEFISKAVAKQLVDPASTVTPVIEEPVVPAATTTSTTTPTVVTPAKPPVTPVTTKPVTTTPKPAATAPAKPAGTTKGTIAKKTPAKKKTGR